MKQPGIIVDLSRCLVYGQCVFAAPTVFSLRGDDCLEFDPAPDPSMREHVLRAARACPVQAISVGWTVESIYPRGSHTDR